MKLLLKISMAVISATLLVGCWEWPLSGKDDVPSPQNSIYHWKTVFDIDSAEMSFLKKHGIGRIYLRMFDVALEYDFLNRTPDIVPIATTRFASPIPECAEIVPVTYITLDALKAMEGRECEMASLIVERLLAMSRHNSCGNIKEIQFDCDWTASTKTTYISLCKAAKNMLNSMGIELSLTVRAHQLRETPPPADRGVLMLYNTGALKNPKTENSILDYHDISPYFHPWKYTIPLDYAYPIFGWGVKFDNNIFVSIVPYDCDSVSNNEHIRYERPSSYEILCVKKLAEENLGKPSRGNILYHLDYSQFKHYTDDEISKIFSY